LLPRGAFNLYYQVVSELAEPPKYEAIRQSLAARALPDRTPLAAGNLASIVAVGEILWDLFPDGRRLGGAPLNFSAHARHLGHPVSLISALGGDALGAEASATIKALSLDRRYLQISKQLATGTAGVALSADGSPRFAIVRPAAYDDVELTADTLQQLRQCRPAWFYFGSLFAATPRGKHCLNALFDALDGAVKFLDLNLRPGSDDPSLVAELLARANVVKLNEEELDRVRTLTGLQGSLEAFCVAASERFGWRAVAVTLGDRGCAIHSDGDYTEAPGHAVTVVDTVGAGDAFSAALVHGLSQHWPTAKTAEFANRLAAAVAGRPGALPDSRQGGVMP